MRVREAALFYKRVLDIIDARIEGEQLSDAVLKGSDPQATCGYLATLPAYVSTIHREKFLQGSGVRNPVPSQTAATAEAKPHPDPTNEALAQSPSAGVMRLRNGIWG
jgi:hypothetical protein